MSGTRSLSWPRRDADALPADFCRSASVVALGLLVAAAAVVAWRRLAGALTSPPPPAILLTAAVLATSVAAIRGWWRGPLVKPFSRLDWGLMILTSLATAVLTVGLCPSGTPAAWVAAVGALFAAEESWTWLRRLRRRVPSRGAGCQSAVGKGQVGNLSLQEVPPEGVLQQLTRSRAADGIEEISGWLRTCFAAGQRTASVHVAFCPPLAAVPELAVEQIDGPEARIKTAQVLPYGARVDLKLAAASGEPASVLLQFSARTS
jgi:hypothetical protein